MIQYPTKKQIDKLQEYLIKNKVQATFSVFAEHVINLVKSLNKEGRR